ncbi:MAG: hypothetical protein ACRD2W_20980 [Acidimicrobiales bacterium]
MALGHDPAAVQGDVEVEGRRPRSGRRRVQGGHDREVLRATFDSVAELYDRARPQYPDELFRGLPPAGSSRSAAGRARPPSRWSATAARSCALFAGLTALIDSGEFGGTVTKRQMATLTLARKR